jgi:hypothetical protein
VGGAGWRCNFVIVTQIGGGLCCRGRTALKQQAVAAAFFFKKATA